MNWTVGGLVSCDAIEADEAGVDLDVDAEVDAGVDTEAAEDDAITNDREGWDLFGGCLVAVWLVECNR